MEKWTKKWPDEPGIYWFYGYRYGRVSCGRECEKKMCLVTLEKASNGLMAVTEGSFMFKKEVEDYHFMKATLPDPPKENQPVCKDCGMVMDNSTGGCEC